MNRITAAIAAKTVEINGKLAAGKITQAQVDDTSKALDMDMEEHAMFQTKKSLAVTKGMLTLDEGQTVYVALGECVSVFNGQPVAVKAVLTGLFRELLSLSIKEKGGRVPAGRR